MWLPVSMSAATSSTSGSFVSPSTSSSEKFTDAEHAQR
jgi:hypothetical protein